jgi:hypothetical protein
MISTRSNNNLKLAKGWQWPRRVERKDLEGGLGGVGGLKMGSGLGCMGNGSEETLVGREMGGSWMGEEMIARFW